MIFALEIIGTIAFAISGAQVAINKKMDILGVVIMGMTTAVGGGIIRDLIIGTTPPVAFQQPVYALTAIGVSIIAFLPFIREKINSNNIILLLMDSLGLGIFTVIGVRAGAGFDNLFLSVFLGTLTGVGGGVLRDIFAGEKPMIFVKHFYACASILGALVCALIWNSNADIAIISGTIVVVLLRLLAAKFRWELPRA